MGRFDTIKTTIDANIKENGSQEITGQKMNSVLTEMVNATDAELTELESETKIITFDNGETLSIGNFDSLDFLSMSPSFFFDSVSPYINMLGIGDFYFNKKQNTIQRGTSGVKVAYIPISKGKVYRVTAINETKANLNIGFSSNVPSEGVEISNIIEFNDTNIIYYFASPLDGYFVINKFYADFTNIKVYEQKLKTTIDSLQSADENLREQLESAKMSISEAISKVEDSVECTSLVSETNLLSGFREISNGDIIIPLIDITKGGYWNIDETITPYTANGGYNYGVVDLSDYAKKTVKIQMGWEDDRGAHCFMKVDGVMTELTSIYGYQKESDYISLVVPQNSILYWSYAPATSNGVIFTKAVFQDKIEENDANIKSILSNSDIVFNREVGGSFSLNLDEHLNYGDSAMLEVIAYEKPISLELREYLEDGTFFYLRFKGKNELNIMPSARGYQTIHFRRKDAKYIRFENISSDTGARYKVVLHKSSPISQLSCVIPNINNGKEIISLEEERYCHAPYIQNERDYLYGMYQSSTYWGKTSEGDSYHHMNVNAFCVDKYSHQISRKLIISDDLTDDTFADTKVYDSYNASMVADNHCIKFRFGAHYGEVDTLAVFYKNYNFSTGELSEIDICKLSFNGNVVDWTWNNYIRMVNALYGYSFDETLQSRFTLEIAKIVKYAGYYYSVIAHQCTGDSFVNETNVPYILIRTIDGEIWEPIAKLDIEATSAECEIVVKNELVYLAFRNRLNGTYYGVFNFEGTAIKTMTQLDVTPSKPSIFEYMGNAYIAYNTISPIEKYAGRTKLQVVRITDDYNLDNVISYISPSGYQYFGFDSFGSDLMMINSEDNSGINYDKNTGPTCDITLQKVNLFCSLIR